MSETTASFEEIDMGYDAEDNGMLRHQQERMAGEGAMNTHGEGVGAQGGGGSAEDDARQQTETPGELTHRNTAPSHLDPSDSEAPMH